MTKRSAKKKKTTRLAPAAPTDEHMRWASEAIKFIEGMNGRVPAHVRVLVLVSTHHASADPQAEEQCGVFATKNFEHHMICVLKQAIEAASNFSIETPRLH